MSQNDELNSERVTATNAGRTSALHSGFSGPAWLRSALATRRAMNLLRLANLIAALLAGLRYASAQGFVNLGFESTTISTLHYPGGDRYFATLPGWSYYGFPSEGGPGMVNYNDIALDAAAVTLHGTNSLFVPAIQGRYSVFLQGGTIAGGIAYGTNGATVFQTGQIPVSSLSLIYLGVGAVQVSFNGQALPSVALSSTTSVTRWGVDVSAHAGQSGELRFTTPWLTAGVLDGIQFSSTPIPEPSAFALLSLGLLCLFGTMKWLNPLPSPRLRSGRLLS